ncbi:MAG: hypothetical protein JXQ75_14705 [Phycisphaerae bacterium]|nr:hypothetical protein [Phycisphaerae bacterium]
MAAPIHTVPQVIDYPPIRDALLETSTPSRKPVRLPPPSVEREHQLPSRRCLPYAPRYGQDMDKVLQQAGFSIERFAGLRESGIVA